MDNLKSFYAEIDAMEKKLHAGINDVVQETVYETMSALLEPKSQGGTPIITGHLVSNWTVSIDNYDNTVYGSKESVSYIKQNSSIDSFMNMDIIGHNMIWINNAVPYGLMVNNGTGGSPPQLFREKGMRRGEWYLRSAKIK